MKGIHNVSVPAGDYFIFIVAKYPTAIPGFAINAILFQSRISRLSNPAHGRDTG
jgi:hypothetical protein